MMDFKDHMIKRLEEREPFSMLITPKLLMSWRSCWTDKQVKEVFKIHKAKEVELLDLFELKSVRAAEKVWVGFRSGALSASKMRLLACRFAADALREASRRHEIPQVFMTTVLGAISYAKDVRLKDLRKLRAQVDIAYAECAEDDDHRYLDALSSAKATVHWDSKFAGIWASESCIQSFLPQDRLAVTQEHVKRVREALELL